MALHGSAPNEVVHFDFLYLGKGEGGLKYALVIEDDFSGYLWLVATASADAETAASALSRWIRTFTAMSVWVSDQASHFKNKVMRSLGTLHNIQHKFTVAYSPWVNGTVESCMRVVLAACRALSSEMKLGPQDWPKVIGIVQTVLNEAPLQRLGTKGDNIYRSPLEVMTGLPPNRMMLSGTQVEDGAPAGEISMIRATQLLEVEQLQHAMEKMHKQVAKNILKNRARQIRFHNQKTNIVVHNFSVGDFVLVRRAQDKGHKLSYRWMGPRRITRVISEMVYDVSSMVDDVTEQIHAARLLPYRADRDSSSVSEELMDLAERSEAKYELVEKIIDIGEDHDGIFLQVQWQGLPDRRDWTWNYLADMHEDMPEVVEEFLDKSKAKNLVSKAKKFLGIT